MAGAKAGARAWAWACAWVWAWAMVWVGAVAGAEDAAERIPSVPMSRGLKIEDLAAAPGGAGPSRAAAEVGLDLMEV